MYDVHRIVSWKTDPNFSVGKSKSGITKGNKHKYKLKKYGLTPKEYDAKLQAQAYACKICGSYPEKRCLAVDHDHKTNKVRDLLCGRCNMLLGVVSDNPTILLKAIQYLNHWNRAINGPKHAK